MPLSVKKRSKESYFLEKLSMRAKKTQDGVKYSLQNFDKFCKERYHGKDIEKIVSELKNKSKQNDEVIWDLLQEWVNWNHKNSLAAGSIRRYLSGITKFLNYSGIKITPQEIRDNVNLPRKIEEEKFPLTREIIQKIFQVSTYQKKALYLALLSSGMRIGEAVSIRKKHLESVHHNGQVRIKISIPAKVSKNKIGRSVFISREAHSYITNKLRQSDENDLVWGVNENRDGAVLAEQVTFGRYLTKIGLGQRYESTNRRKISLRSFRSYFFTKASRHDHNFAQLITGHSGYLIREYDRLTTLEKMEIYLKFEPELIIDDSERLKIKEKLLEKEKSEFEKSEIANNQLENKLSIAEIRLNKVLDFVEIISKNHPGSVSITRDKTKPFHYPGIDIGRNDSKSSS